MAAELADMHSYTLIAGQDVVKVSVETRDAFRIRHAAFSVSAHGRSRAFELAVAALRQFFSEEWG